MAINITRRKLIISQAMTMASAVFWQPWAQAQTPAMKGYQNYPFTLGIAAGDPLPDSCVLWTRLAPFPFEPEAMSKDPVAVGWEISEDARFKKIQQSGVAIGFHENAFAIHVDVQGLASDRDYFYRFVVKNAVSPTGRFRTLPAITADVDHFRFAFASCQARTDGYYAAYRDMVKQDPQLIVHTGDYIYESDWVGGVRRIAIDEAFSLSDYRQLYAAYKIDPALQAAHASAAWLSIWDDHEVENDWGGSYSQDGLDETAFFRRKAAAFKAYYEHMPLRSAARPNKDKILLYSRSVVGRLLQLDLLDCRQYRDYPACLDEDPVFRHYQAVCDQALDAERSLLGEEQEAWLYRGLGTFDARWNAIIQTTMLGRFDYAPGNEAGFDLDGWDAYPENRTRLLSALRNNKVNNPVSLGGNIHAYYTGVVGHDDDKHKNTPILSEIVGTSISSAGGGLGRHRQVNEQFSENPQARFFDNRYRGYVLCDVTPATWRNTFRVIDDVRDPQSPARTLATATIENERRDVLMS